MEGRRSFLKKLFGGAVASVAITSAAIAPVTVESVAPKRKRRPTKKERQEAIFAAFCGTVYQPNVMNAQHTPLYDSLTVGECKISAPERFWENAA